MDIATSEGSIERDMKRNGVFILWMITTVLFGSIYFTHGTNTKENKISIAGRLKQFVTCGVKKQTIKYKSDGCEDKGNDNKVFTV